MNSDKFIQSKIPGISFYCDNENEEIVVLHKNENSLLKFSFVKKITEQEVNDAIFKCLSELNWDKSFEEVFTYQRYRKALMKVPNVLMGE